MITTDLEQFVKAYIAAWSATDREERKYLVEKVYNISAEFFADEPGDHAVKHSGIGVILENITQVNKRLTVDNALTTECTGFSENHNIIRVAWQMKDKDDRIAMKGMNFLQKDNSGRIEKDYIFIN
ncbi:hypothetical protein [Chryseobacterium shigense]|uniref:SnoaL-like domain-containing protein n=1 Tax=Chryseobacterium shigense TaxID=297244 RepID=A0A841MXN3_9FLAO|nr:hypothetical protein [Chryseobacterium shigense]MBB6369696.1 hypothetical protein [Chryseobacterium shigense]